MCTMKSSLPLLLIIFWSGRYCQGFVPIQQTKSLLLSSSSFYSKSATELAASIDILEAGHTILQTATSTMLAVSDTGTSASDYIPGTTGEVTYSKASYYVILGLYLISFPGLWSTIKRSTKAKVKRKTYVSDGEQSPDGDGKGLREQAGEIMAYMKANNYDVVDAGETITFEGVVQRSVSQACFLVFCSFIGLASFALVVSIQFNSLGKFLFQKILYVCVCVCVM